MSKYGNSSYWLKDWEDEDSVVDTMSVVEKKSNDLYKMAASKRAISNFVNIVTNDQIAVKFSERGDSYTDGKSVVIGSNISEPKDFDVAVGLALHEGSHIKLSDFQVLKDIYNIVPTHITDGAIKKGIMNSVSIIKDLWNVVEDRRIDKFVFDSAPGYRDYYRAMYDKYFNDKLIDKALQSDEYTEESVDSYMFRIINIHNKNTDLTALKGLRDIYKTMGLGSIDRLKSSLDAFNVALTMFQTIMSNLPTSESEEGDGDGSNDQQSEQPQNGNGGNGSDEPREMTEEEFDDLMNSVDGESPTGGSDESPTGSGGMELDNVPDEMGTPSDSTNTDETETTETTEKVKLSDRQKQLLQKKIQKQKDFLDGDIKKKKITKKDNINVEAIQESGSEVTSVGSGIESYYGNHQKGTKCIVVKRLTQSLLESSIFPMSYNNWNVEENGPIDKRHTDAVNDGIRIGTMLGKKLQVRGEDRNTIFNRQKYGKIDKRMISSLGFGNENVFQYMETDSYKKANLHVSIDASGSMNGGKWTNTMTNVVALCKAVDMIQNLSIQVTFRTTSGEIPYIVMAYDSRSDKFSKVKQMFPSLNVGGTTPEGLCFEAIMKNFLGSNNDMDSYFLNISDGEPYFGNNDLHYSGEPAYQHTRKMVKQIEGMGIQTLSYYVDDYVREGEEPSKGFKIMYGAGAKLIDLKNVSQITKTMNGLFLQK
jgi:cobalamin biosynthesis protein CobT